MQMIEEEMRKLKGEEIQTEDEKQSQVLLSKL